MGRLVEGVWHDVWQDTGKTGGRFVRADSVYRNWITADGAPGPTGSGGFEAEAGRYHLYVSWACPWAHRTLIFRKLKGLEDMISLSVTHPFMGKNGWTFRDGDGVIPDTVNGARYLYEVYQKADPAYSGKVTVPTLWDKKKGTIVSNESAEIIRMFNDAFDGIGAAGSDYYPPELRDGIEDLNGRIYETVNNGVYRAGFATTQEAYEEAVRPLFETLDFLDRRLADRRYLMGDRITEADWRLFTTLMRFDSVYAVHFKCSIRRIVDYPHLWGYLRDLYQVPGVAETVNMDHIKRHYYQSHDSINPSGIVPVGPSLDFLEPHGRERLGGTS
ncbi:MAG: glutathione S-transferase family protein [Rhodospirillales bacterium]